MPDLATVPAARRPELVLSRLGDNGHHVVKDPRTGEYFYLGEQEHFLLSQFDGEQSPEATRAAFEARFGEPLSEEDLNGFWELAEARGFLEPGETQETRAPPDSRSGQGGLTSPATQAWSVPPSERG